jgi:hypothetical protein
LGRRLEEDCIQTWKNYWLKRGISAASLSAWRLINYSWDLEIMPDDLKRICEAEMLTF